MNVLIVDLHNKMKKYLILLCCLLAVSTLTYSQAEEADIQDGDNISIAKIVFEVDETNLRINDLSVDNNNRVLVATDKGLIITGGSKNDELFLAGSDISCVTANRKLNIYAGGKGKIYLLTEAKEVKVPGTGVLVKDIAYKAGKLWIGTNNGLMTYTLSSGNWTEYNSSNSKLKSNKINNIRIDEQDVIWVGTEKGYLRIKGDKWELQDKKANVVATRSNKEGQWMIASDDMFLIDPYNRKYPIGLDKEFYSGQVNDFVIDNKGRVYMASNILVRYNPYEEKVERYGADVGLLSQQCMSLACDKNNNIWIGTADAGLFTIVFDDVAKEQLTVTPLLQQGITCAGGKDAIVKLSVSGGQRPYKYRWSDRSVRGNNPTGLAPGSYAVTVSDKNGAEVVSSVEVEDLEPITIVVVENRRISGDNKRDGYIALATAGGVGKLTTSWSNGKTGNIIDKLPSDNYTATVTDENGCTAKKVVRVRKERYIPELDISKVAVGQKLRINELNFQADSTNIDPDNFEILDEVYEFLVSNKDVVIEIGGHTNTIPAHSYCDKLSAERAKSVQEYIVERGITADRITYKGYGKREPLTESTSLSGRRKNQRVEVTILSM